MQNFKFWVVSVLWLSLVFCGCGLLKKDEVSSAFIRSNSIAVDTTGNVYVTGRVDDDLWIRKYDTNGNTLWTKTYNGSGNSRDSGNSLTIDTNDNVYVCGYESASSEGTNLWIRKYDSNGNTLWTQTYNSSTNSEEAGSDIVVDSSGNIYITGYEETSNEAFNIWIGKYDSTPTLKWKQSYSISSESYEYGQGITVDGEGNLYVVGYGYRRLDGSLPEVLVLKYDKDGNLLGKLDLGSGYGWGITVDSSKNLYVTGGGAKTLWLKKYNYGSLEAWTKSRTLSSGGRDLVLDTDNNIYVAGYELITEESSNIWVGKYNSQGEILWTATYNGSQNSYDEGMGIAVDSNGNVYVAGYELNEYGTLKAWIRKYNKDGDILWTKIHSSLSD